MSERVEVVVLVRDPDRTLDQVGWTLSELEEYADAVRVSGTAKALSKVPLEQIASLVRSRGLEFGIGLIGPASGEFFKIAASLADYLVVHVPPSPELSDKLAILGQNLGEKLVVQVDLTVAPMGWQEPALKMFLVSIPPEVRDGALLVELSSPSVDPELENLLQTLISQPSGG